MLSTDPKIEYKPRYTEEECSNLAGFRFTGSRWVAVKKQTNRSLINGMREMYDAMSHLSIYDQFMLIKQAEERLVKH